MQEPLGREPFNVLTVLASGFAIKRHAGAWRVMLPPARPGGSTEVTEATMGALIAAGLVTTSADSATITSAGRGAVNDAHSEAMNAAAAWLPPTLTT